MSRIAKYQLLQASPEGAKLIFEDVACDVRSAYAKIRLFIFLADIEPENLMIRWKKRVYTYIHKKTKYFSISTLRSNPYQQVVKLMESEGFEVIGRYTLLKKNISYINTFYLYKFGDKIFKVHRVIYHPNGDIRTVKIEKFNLSEMEKSLFKIEAEGVPAKFGIGGKNISQMQANNDTLRQQRVKALKAIQKATKYFEKSKE